MGEGAAIQISIVIPIYNVEKCLPDCLESVLQQSYSDLQVILVEDGSPDGSAAICDAYAAKDARVQVIHKKNEGASVARNVGIRAANGKYIMFVDSDDQLELTACEALLRQAEAVSADVVAGTTRWIDRTGGEAQKEEVCIMRPYPIDEEILDGETYMLRQLLNNTYMSTIWAFMYNRDFLMRNKLYFMEGVVREDEEWVQRMFCCARRVTQCDVFFYKYYLWKNSVMRDPASVRMAKDFIDKVCPRMMKQIMTVDNKPLQELCISHIVRTYLAAISAYPAYYAEHTQEIDFAFLKKYTKGKIWVWITILRFNTNLFCTMWNARSSLKK